MIQELLLAIHEKWHKTLKTANGDYVDVYKNPSRKDITEIRKKNQGNRVRFVADKYGEVVYIWDAISRLLHVDVEGEENLSTIFRGQASNMGGELYIKLKDSNAEIRYDDMMELIGNRGLIKDNLDGDYDWMGKYNFNMRKLKERINTNLEVIDDIEGELGDIVDY